MGSYGHIRDCILEVILYHSFSLWPFRACYDYSILTYHLKDNTFFTTLSCESHLC